MNNPIRPLSRITLYPKTKAAKDLTQTHTVWEVVQIDRQSNEVLVEAVLDTPTHTQHKKKLATAMWIKTPTDPRFIYWRVE